MILRYQVEILGNSITEMKALSPDIRTCVCYNKSMNKAIKYKSIKYKYRLYPTTEQAVMFAKTFGCCRKVYNLMLSDKIESYKSTGKFSCW